MKFTIKDFFSKCDQIYGKLRIWSHLLKKSLMENIIFCAVNIFVELHLQARNQNYLKVREVAIKIGKKHSLTA